MNHTRRSSRHARRGLTLIEMLISVALTLMIVFALVSVFDLIGKSVTDSRAIIELSGNLRGAANRLQQDLAGLTVTTLPPRDPSSGEGYFEIVDGPTTDRQHYVVATGGTSTYVDLASSFVDPVGDGFVEGPVPFDTSVGDTDDILAFTTRSQDEPFTGQVSHPGVRLADPINTNQEWSVLDSNRDAIPDLPTRTLESQVAEVIWWLQVDRTVAIPDITMIQGLPEAEQLGNAINGEVQLYPNSTNTTLGTPVRSLHRRVMLIRPDLEFTNTKGEPLHLKDTNDVASFQTNNDISVRFI
ncbi:MAG: PilW family protein, partial [Pseudomonadales bacterium]